MDTQTLFSKLRHAFTALVFTAIFGYKSSLAVAYVIPTSPACQTVFADLTHGSSGMSTMIHVKFQADADTNSPLLLIPPKLRGSVASIKPLFSLSNQQLNSMGANRLKAWFKITLKPGVDTDVFLKSLLRAEHVEVAEPAPRPVPPP